MDNELRALLDELARVGREHDKRETDHAKKMLNLEPETAALVHLLLRSSRRRNVLEIGTSNGYSTLWLAAAVRETGGRVASIDRSASKHRLAEENLRRGKLRDLVDLHLGEATEVVGRLEGTFDCLFFDADRVSAPAQLEKLLPMLSADVLLLADNALSHPAEISAYLTAISSRNEFEAIVVPIGKGLSVAHRFEAR
ncbi:MAG TPA: class I SAM-dependent methyltransferase [Spirochaetia bacterium]|nr:class I SAM-dependent methyltransferase [Spirochaetia bacterium]